MAGAPPEQAAAAFVALLRRTVWWLTDEPLLQLPDPSGTGSVLAFRGRDAALESRNGYRRIWRVSRTFRVVEAPTVPTSWKIAPTAYFYEFRLVTGRENRKIIAYHRHPDGASAITWPHAHFHTLTAPVDLSGGHFPTGRVPLAAVVRYAIMDLKVPPLERLRQPRPRESTVLAQFRAAAQVFEAWSA